MASRRLIVEILGDDASLQRALGGASASTAGFGDRMQAAGKRISSVGKTLTTHLTLPLVAVGYFAGKAAVDFQASMELLHTQAGVGQSSVDKLSKSVLALAGPTATAPDQLSVGLFHLTSQGLRGKQALDALRVAAEGSKMGMADMEDATNALGAIMFARIKDIKNVSDAMGQMNAIVGTGDMHFQDLADAMGTKLPSVLQAVHLSLKQAGAALAIFGDQNIRGAQAGTMLGSALQYMVAPSHAAEAAMQSFGLSGKKFADDLAGPGGQGKSLEDLHAALQQVPKDEQQAALVGMFTKKGGTGVQILLDQLDRFSGKLDGISKGGSKFASDWAAYTKTTAYHLASMGAQMQATGITIGTILLPVIAKIADFIGKLATKFESLSPTVQKAILIFAGVAAAIGPVMAVLGSLIEVVVFLADPIVLLVAGVAALVGAMVAAVVWPDKLKAALERMGLSAHAAGRIVADLRKVFHIVETAVMALVGVVRDNWATISAIFKGAFDVIKTIVETTVGVIQTIWRNFGGTLKAIAETVWGNIKGTIKNDLEVIRGVIDFISGLIHGDWAKVWKGIQEIVGGVLKQIWNQLKTAVMLLGDTAKLIGQAIWKGIIQPLLHFAEDLIQTIEHAILRAVHAVVDWVPHEVGSIGKGIADGIIHGATGLGKGLLDTLTGGASGAISGLAGALGIGSPSRVFAERIGKPIAQGIIAGYLEGIRGFPAGLSASMRQGLEQARQVVDGYRSKFATAFAGIQSAVDQAMSGSVSAAATEAGKKLAAFLKQFALPVSGPVSDASTAAGQQLAALQAAHDDAARQQALQDAQAQLSGAQSQLSGDQAAGASPATIAADQQAVVQAQQAIADAQYQIQVSALQQQAQLEADSANAQAAALQKQADREAKHETEMRAMRKHQADAALAALRARLSKEGATHREAQEAIVRLLKRFGLTYRDVAADMGKKFADGLESSIHLTAKAAEELAREIAKYLPHSPAEKGPLSKPLGWDSYLLDGLSDSAAGVSSVLGDALSGGVSRGGRGRGQSSSVGGATFTGPLFGELHIHADNYIGDRRELEDGVVTALSQWARRNGRSDLRSLLGASV